MTSCGSIVLPSDFDIFLPSSSIRKPCVSTALNGGAATRAEADEQRALEPAAVLVAAFEIDVRRPRQLRPERQHRLVARSRVEPHVEDVRLALEASCRRTSGRRGPRARTPRSAARTRRRRRTGRTPPPRARRAPASGPPRRSSCSRRRESARPTRAGARCTSRAGWRPCCRCGRGPTPGSTAPGGRSRAAPPRAASSANCRRRVTTGSPSIRTNHCDVARKITGLWQRQQCG